jgi:hypothetical protein
METKRKKIILISAISIIIIVIVFIFIRLRQQNTNQEGNSGFKKFLDLGSLFTGKRQTPDGVNQANNGDKENSNNNEDGNNINNRKNTPFVIAGLPTPTPIAQNIGGGFGTNDINLIPTGENPNNCISCNDYPVNPTDPTEQPGSGDGFSSVFINAVPSSIHKDDEVTVSWDSYNVNVCTASSFPVITGWNGRVAKTGNKSFAIKTPTTFVVKCTTNTTSVQASDSVAVVPKDIPVCDTNECSIEDPIYNTLVSVVMEASPYLVNKNTTSNLTWDSENATSCNAHSIPQKNDWKGLIEDNEGDANVLLGEEPTTYVLTCTDGKTTGQTDLTISIDTSGIGDTDIGDDPVDLCSKAGEEQNPLCKAKDIDYEGEIKMLILTEEEESRLEALMKEVAVMSPTLPSNQTASSIEISTRTYRTILDDINKNINSCHELTRNQQLIDALWERGIAGRRNQLPFGQVKNKGWTIKYPQMWPSQNLINKYKSASSLIVAGKKTSLAEGGLFINSYAVNYWMNGVNRMVAGLVPARQLTIQEVNADPSLIPELDTFITPPIFETIERLEGPAGDQEDTDCCAYRSKVIMYEWWPYYWRMQEQVEYGANTKGVKIY